MRIKHKGLRALYEQDNAAKVPADLVSRLRRVLTALQAAARPHDVTTRPGLRIHPLRGTARDTWSVAVSGNRRVVFRFENAEAVDVDLIDYH